MPSIRMPSVEEEERDEFLRLERKKTSIDGHEWKHVLILADFPCEQKLIVSNIRGP